MPTLKPDSTYQTTTIPLIPLYDSRDADNTYDDLLFNFLVEKYPSVDGEKLRLVKRSGSKDLVASTGTGSPRGIFYWTGFNKIFACIGADIYIYDGTTYALLATLAAAFALADTPVGFTSYLYADGTSVIMCTDGTTLNKITTANVITASATVAGVVGSHIATPVYYNGYLLLVKSGTGDCYNSNLDDPMTWTAGNFITAEINSDTLFSITKVNNYFLLLGKSTIEYFYDVGNPTGTPFARNDVFVKNTGFVQLSAASYGNQVYICGKRENATPEVFVLEDFTLNPISTPAVRRWLVNIGPNVRGFIFSISGHDLYVLSGDGTTYFYDITSKVWGRLGYLNNQQYFSLRCVTRNTDREQQETIFMTNLDNAIHQFDYTLYQDSGVNFYCIMRTQPLSFGTKSNKFMSSLSIYADRSPSVGTIDISFSDDDYATYSTPRTIDLASERPNGQQWGRFRTRAFKFSSRSNNPLRIQGIELDFNVGTT